MPSSTSSSDPSDPDLATQGRLVEGGWPRAFAAAVVLSLAFLGWWEGRWRSEGVLPSVTSLDVSWSLARDRVGSDSLVLLGTSKMQSAIDPAILGESLGREPAVQLALIDRSPLPILEHLAEDARFSGTVIVDVAPRIFFDGSGGREAAAREILAAYADYSSGPGERIDARLVLRVENALALRRPAFSLRSLVEERLVGRPIRRPFARVRLDRFREIDFGRMESLEARIRSQATIVARAGRPASKEETRELIQRVAAAADAIEARGGQVVLTLLPITGRARLEEEQRFPREIYWDRLVAETGLEGMHFADHRSLTFFECPDGVHLDASQSGPFTSTFASLLLGDTDLPVKLAFPR